MAIHRFTPTTYYNVIGTFPPALRIANGDTVITRTLDAAGDDEHGVNRSGGPNPMNGPIFVEGAEPGDALRVQIMAMEPTRDTGWTRQVLAANVVDPEFVRVLPPRNRTEWRIDRAQGTVQLQDPVPGLEHLVLPLAPMIGCFGVAPTLGQAISTATSAEHGGNMDYRRFGPGTTVWFPVAAPGALFFLGDGHAIQGDGEIVGTGVETSFEVTITLSVEKRRPQVWPRAETAEEIITIGNARPLDQALQHATTEMAQWLGQDFGLDLVTSSHLLGQVVRYDVANVFDPAYTVACRLPKRFLPRRHGV
ncbi:MULTISPECIES: acetamidase/formamidase family protein [unclassified Devosia]|uniref:acetamidase/formamidase family protein n=1 Tax=unclassified Devosia TaxID=196773 RepID=UPI00155603CD|nr:MULTISPECIES: acetamidase/formamidase family protein [unclassified Devosia]